MRLCVHVCVVHETDVTWMPLHRHRVRFCRISVCMHVHGRSVARSVCWHADSCGPLQATSSHAYACIHDFGHVLGLIS